MSYPQGQYPDPNQQPTWGSPQHGSGYGNQDQPQSGGGHYGQDPYGQQPQPGYQQPQPGYPPAGGSPYGPTSGSPYGQPTQPQYPGYGDQQGYPQSGGGAYGQPGGYGQPDQGWYGGAPTPTPPRKSRAPLIVGVIVLAVLVLGGAAATVFFVTKSNSTTTASSSSGPSSSTSGGRSTAPTTGTTTGGTSTATVTFAAPSKIGTYTKAADDATVQSMRSQMQAAGLSDPFTAVYQDSAAAGQRVVMWGGAGSIFGGSSDVQLNAFFTSAAKSLNGTLGPKVTADPGALGGKAQCSKVSGTGATLALCAWSGSNALLGFIFTSITPEKAATQVKTILPAVAVKN